MVIPLPSIPVPLVPPPECAQHMNKLKYSILAMIGFGAGRALFACIQGSVDIDFFALLNLFMSIVMGTFMFKDDEHLRGFYECLAKTICQTCAEQMQGGMQCLVPFMVCTLINAVSDLLLRGASFNKMPYGFFLLGSVIAQGVAVYFAYQVFKVARSLQSEGSGDWATGGGGLGGGGYSRPQASAPEQYDADDAGAVRPQAGGFVPFAGQGNRLGA
mmetsp:Transcript_109267/g.305704  ORF Transcript_109267/g.305704 Transcript_109267/m.305704 type:complete len:216 (+) Transcript_109267:110-757(+)